MPAQPADSIVIVCYWLQETLTRWHLPYDVWHPIEVDLLLAHNGFEGLPTNTPEQEQAIERLFTLMFGPEGNQQNAPWTPHLAGGTGGVESAVNAHVAHFILTGSDPC